MLLVTSTTLNARSSLDETGGVGGGGGVHDGQRGDSGKEGGDLHCETEERECVGEAREKRVWVSRINGLVKECEEGDEERERYRDER